MEQQSKEAWQKKDKVWILVQEVELVILARDGKPVFT